MGIRVFTVFGVLVLAAAFPAAGAVVCAAILSVQLSLIAVRPILAYMPARVSPGQRHGKAPLFSIHVATHAEPPDLVIATLCALLDQDWSCRSYEIIVMDNNTVNPALWKPIERFCAAHPDRIKFLHRTGVVGAKAGALNIALQHTHPEASHIVTVDADYVVRRDFLSRAAEALDKTGADYVQFPQSYIGTATAAPGVDAELEEYFRANATVADEAEAVLLTGTLCVIAKKALFAAGGWSGATTTEDAELGVRLCCAGFTGRFINLVVGQGILPLSLKDLEQQRYRWCSGNFQTLLHHLGTLLTPAVGFNLHKRLVIVSQLSAWFNLALIPSFLLMAWLLTGQGQSTAATLAAGVIVLTLCDITMRVIGRGLRDGLPPSVMLHALACRVALAPQSAKATLDALTGIRLRFVVTDKFSGGAPRAADLPACQTSLGIIAVALLIGIQPEDPLIIAALLTLMLPLPSALVTDRSLRTYRNSIAQPKMEAVP